MLSPEDIDGLRASGLSDDKIVDSIKALAPHTQKEIDGAKESGISSTDILKHIDLLSAPPQPAGKSIGQKAVDLVGAATTGVANEFHQLAGTTKDLGMPNAASALGTMGDTADSFTPGSYRPSEFHVNDPSTYTNLPEKLAGAAPGALATIGAGTAAAGLVGLAGVSAPVVAGAGLVGAGAYGAYKYLHGIAEERAKNNGRTEVTSDDLKAALPAAIASGAIDAGSMKLGGFIGKDAGEIAASVPKTMATQYLGSAGSNVVQQAGGTLGTDKGLHVDPMEAVDSGVIGAVGAGVAKRAGEGIDAIRDLPLRKFDPEFFNKHAQDVAEAYGKNTAEKTANAAGNATRDFEVSIKPAERPQLEPAPKAAKGTTVDPAAKEAVKVRNDAALEEWKAGNEVPQSVTEAKDAIERGTVLTKADLAALKEDLASHHNGPGVIDALGRMNEANKLAGSGHYITRALEATGLVKAASAGGFAKKAGNSLYPYISGGTVTYGMLHGNPMLAAAGLLAPLGLKGLASAADAGLGFDNPVARWQAKQAVMAKLSPPPAPQAPPSVPSVTSPLPEANVPAQAPLTPADMAQVAMAVQAARSAPQARPQAPVAKAPEKAAGGPSKPILSDPNVVPLNFGDEVTRMQPISEISGTAEGIQRGGTRRVEQRARIYDSEVPGLDAASKSQWKSLSKKPTGPDANDGGAIREHFNRNSFDGVKSAEDAMKSKLEQHGVKHKHAQKIVKHLKSKGFFRTYKGKRRGRK